MSIICPAILADTPQEYALQLANVPQSERLHIDFMDGSMTDTKSIKLAEAKLPLNKMVDLHVMYDRPQDYLDTLIKIKPNMVIVQAESHCDIVLLATQLKENGIKTGLAIQSNTTPKSVSYILPHVQQVLIFSGHLGHFGGKADLNQVNKVAELKSLHRYLEFAWDGGANDSNVEQLVRAGIEIINVGGFIQKAKDPSAAFAKLTNLLS